MEVWVDTKTHPNFEVSSLGNVRNKKTGRIMKQQNSTHGYKQLMIDHKIERVHRLVADSFYDGEHEGLDVNHKDGNKTNNFIGNLEWCTRKENIKHAYDHGLSKNNIPIRIIETGDIYRSIKQCAEKIDGDRISIYRCLHNQQQTHKGYHFEYVN